MIKDFLFVITALCLLQVSLFSQEGRKRELVDHQWKFAPGDLPEAREPDLDDSGWRGDLFERTGETTDLINVYDALNKKYLQE
ncbi:MAG TPA: hypothetical protein ENO05_12525 [Bacteroides sp.]|nr:hypothetical protein [Bacteroides sp.]